jgi:hypothetical protein
MEKLMSMNILMKLVTKIFIHVEQWSNVALHILHVHLEQL